MKNVLNKTLSVVAAVALVAQSMVLMAFAAIPAAIPITKGTTVTGTGAQDIFVYQIIPKPTEADTTTKITGFELAHDWLVLDLPADTTVAVPADGNVSLISTTTPVGAFQVLTVSGMNNADRIITSTTPILRSVTVSGLKDGKIEKGQTLTLTPVTTYSNNTAPTSNLTYTLKNGTQVLSTTGTGPITYITTTAGSYADLTLTVNTTGTPTPATSLSIPAFTVTQCTAKAIGVSITPTTALNLDKDSVTQQLTATVTFDKTAADCGGTHTNGATHDQNVACQWAVATDSPSAPNSGVSISPTGGMLTVNRKNLPGDAKNAVVTVTSPAATGTVSIPLTRVVVCDYTTSTLAFQAPTAIVNAETTSTLAYPVTQTVTGTYCNGIPHTNPATHDRAVTWSVTPQVAGTDMAGISMANGSLTLDKKLLKMPTTNIVITAASDGKSISTNVQVTRNAICNKEITSLGNVNVGAATAPNTLATDGAGRVIWTINGATATLPFTMVGLTYSGTCEHAPGSCPNILKHDVRWSLDADYTGRGITINSTTGVMNVVRGSLNSYETRVGVLANGNGKPQTIGYIVIRNSAYTPPTPGGDTDTDGEDVLYSKLEDQLAYAERKDVLWQDISEYPDMPGRLLNELRGKDVTLELYMGNGYTWSVNGKNLQKVPAYQIYIPLEITRVSNADILDRAKGYDIKGFEIAHEGSLYGTYQLEIQVGSSYAGQPVYLYKYVEGSARLSYKGAAKADGSGYVTFPFTSASTYILTERPLYGETANTKPGGGTTGGGTTGGGTTGGTGGTVAPPPPSQPTAPPSSSSSPSSSVAPSAPESIISSSEASQPVVVAPEVPEKQEKPKAKIPIIVPILLVIVTITIIAVILLAKGGRMNMGD